MKVNLDKPSQDELLVECQPGSEDAFRELFKQYHKRVLRIAYRLCGNIQEAEDVTQEVFLKVFKELNKFRKTASLFTWLYRITINLCLDKRRKRQRREKYRVNTDLNSENILSEKAPSDEGMQTLDHQIWQDEIQNLLQTALSQIKPKLRTVIVLKDIEGLTYGEVAQVVECSEGTISSRLNRGRKQLKELLSKMGVDEKYFQER